MTNNDLGRYGNYRILADDDRLRHTHGAQFGARSWRLDSHWLPFVYGGATWRNDRMSDTPRTDAKLAKYGACSTWCLEWARKLEKENSSLLNLHDVALNIRKPKRPSTPRQFVRMIEDRMERPQKDIDDLHKQLANLSLLCRKLIRELRKHVKHSGLADRGEAYLTDLANRDCSSPQRQRTEDQ
jgi:hypothetical protein